MTFYRGLNGLQLPTGAALLQAMGDRGVRPVPPSNASSPTIQIREVLATSDATSLLVIFGFLKADQSFTGSGYCILRGSDAIWSQSDESMTQTGHVISHFTNRWGDHIQVNEGYTQPRSDFWALNSIQIQDQVGTGTITLSMESLSNTVVGNRVYTTYPNGTVVTKKFPEVLTADAAVKVTNTLGLPETRLVGKFYSKQRFWPWRAPWSPNYNAFSTPPPPNPEGKWEPGFDFQQIVTTASNGESKTSTLVWGQVSASFPNLPLEFHHPNGLVEKFSYETLVSTSTLSFSRWDGRWMGFHSWRPDKTTLPASMELLSIPHLGATQVQRIDSIGGSGECIKVSRIRPRWTLTYPNIWDCSETRNLTAILHYPIANPQSGTPFRAVRLTHPTFTSNLEGPVSSPQGYLFATSTTLFSESITGVGIPSDATNLGNEIYKVVVFDGFDLSSWANPTGSLTGALPQNAVARRTRVYSKDLPTQITVAGNPNVPGSVDGYGPVLTDEYTDVPQSLPTPSGTTIPLWSSALPAEESLKAVKRRGQVQRSYDASLMRLLVNTDRKTLEGTGLPALRFSAPNGQSTAQAPTSGISSADFGTTTYAYDTLGRISSQKGERNGFTALEQRAYVDGLPLLRETTQNPLTGPGGPYYPNPDNSAVAAGKVYTWADTHVQAGPSTVQDKTDGRTESYQYDALGWETNHTDLLGITTTTSYDAWGRRSEVKRLARGSVGEVKTQFTYDVNGAWKDETITADGKSLRTRTEMDAFGRAVKVTTFDADGAQATHQTFNYDGFGQKVSQSPVLVRNQDSWGTETWTYDGQGRITEHKDTQQRLLQRLTLQSTWTTISGITAVWTTTQDDRLFTRSDAVDLLGQKRATIDQAGQLSEYFYDQDGHLLQTLQGNQQRSYTYNAMGWMTSRTEPEEGTTAYSKFTQSGMPLVVQQYGRNGVSVRNTFTTTLDVRLRPTLQSAVGSEGSVVRTLTYDPGTRLLTAIQEAQPNGTMTETYGYDDLFRLSSKTVSDGTMSFAVDRTFDAMGRVGTLTYPSADGLRDRVVYAYDAVGRMSAVTVSGETRPRGSMVYDQVSGTSVSQVLTYGNNTWTTSRADRGELAQVTHVAPVGTLEDHVMAWTAGGLLTGRGTDTFGYDALQRLNSTHVLNPQTGTYVDQGFSYDRYGNRTSSTTTAPAGTLPTTSEALTWTAPYGNSNDLPASVSAPGGSLFTGVIYDELGRMKQVWTKPGQSGTQTSWIYDPSGRIVWENGTSYLLDSQGLRFRRTRSDLSAQYTVYGFDREPLSVYEVAAPAGDEELWSASNSAVSAQTVNTVAGKGVVTSALGKTSLSKQSAGGIEMMSGHWTPAVTLTAAPATIRPGESAVLTCDVINADYSELSDYGPLGYSEDELIEYITVRPSTTTTYVLTAYNGAGSSTAVVTVTVDEGPPPPPPPPPPPSTSAHNLIYGFGQLISESLPTGAIYIQGDQVGSPNLITNSSGVLINRTKNLPFGERLLDGLPGVPKSLRRYTNHEEDPDSNAIYMQARTYLAAYGKFAQVDPAYDQTKDDPESWNLYNYVTNNPVTHTDPDGRYQVTIDGLTTVNNNQNLDQMGYGNRTSDGFAMPITYMGLPGGGSFAMLGIEAKAPTAQTVPPPASPGGNGSTTGNPQAAAPTSVTLLGNSVPIVYGPTLTQADKNAAGNALQGATDLINSKASQLTSQETSIIQGIKQFSVDPNIHTGITNQAGGVYNIQPNYLKSNTAWLASTIAHDSFHIYQYQQGQFYNRQTAVARERAADAFQMRVGAKLGLQQYELNWIYKDMTGNTHTAYNVPNY